MYLLNNNRQWTVAAKAELKKCSNTEFPVTSAKSNIAPYKISDYVIKTENRLCMLLLQTINTSIINTIMYAPDKNILKNIAVRCDVTLFLLTFTTTH